MHFRIELPALNPHGNCRARPCPACQGFPGASLENPQPYVRAVDDLHETHIHPFREARVSFDRRSKPLDGRRVDGRNRQYRVRIAHRDRTYLDYLRPDGERVAVSLFGCFEGQGAGVETGRSHIDRHHINTLNAGTDESGRAVEGDGCPVRLAAPVQKRRDTARPVAALLHLVSVGVEDAIEHGRIRPAGSFQDERLVESDSGVAIGEPPQLAGGRQ